jgi:hypothetical protein
MTNRVVVPALQAGNRFLGSLKGIQIRALNTLIHLLNALCMFIGVGRWTLNRIEKGGQFLFFQAQTKLLFSANR